MFQASVIGFLGADAVLNNNNGKQFVSFRVSHNERIINGDGIEQENTTWVSCTLNGNGGKLLQSLRKGTRVYVCGDARLRCYPSEKMRGYVAGINIFVRTLELCSAKPKDEEQQQEPEQQPQGIIEQYMQQKQQKQPAPKAAEKHPQQNDLPF